MSSAHSVDFNRALHKPGFLLPLWLKKLGKNISMLCRTRKLDVGGSSDTSSKCHFHETTQDVRRSQVNQSNFKVRTVELHKGTERNIYSRFRPQPFEMYTEIPVA